VVPRVKEKKRGRKKGIEGPYPDKRNPPREGKQGGPCKIKEKE